MGKNLPNALEAEKKLLSAMMLKDGLVIPSVMEILESADFYRVEHRHIFTGLVNIYESGVAPDVLLLEDELMRTDKLKYVDRKYLHSLIDYEFTTSRALVHARLIKEKSQLRWLQELGESVAEQAGEEERPVEEILESIDTKVQGALKSRLEENMRPLGEVLVESIEEVRLRSKTRSNIIGLPTGLLDLDRVTQGLKRSNLIILAARPGMGKTALALNMAVAASAQVPVVFFSLEMNKEELSQRLLSARSGVAMRRIQTGELSSEQMGLLIEAAEALGRKEIYIDDTANLSLRELKLRAKRMMHKHKIGLIVVDYLQLMQASADYRGNRVQEVSELSRGLKGLAKELDVPVLALSQLSRSVEQRADKRPQLSDLRDSGSIEQDADVVMFLYRREYYERDNGDLRNVAELVMGKNRNGALRDVMIHFTPELMLFRDLLRSDVGCT